MNNKLYNENLLSAGFCEMTDAELESVDGGLSFGLMCTIIAGGAVLLGYVNGLYGVGEAVGKTLYYRTH